MRPAQFQTELTKVVPGVRFGSYLRGQSSVYVSISKAENALVLKDKAPGRFFFMTYDREVLRFNIKGSLKLVNLRSF